MYEGKLFEVFYSNDFLCSFANGLVAREANLFLPLLSGKG